MPEKGREAGDFEKERQGQAQRGLGGISATVKSLIEHVCIRLGSSPLARSL